MKKMNWLQISDIGNRKIVKSMYVWMIITPIIAKIMSSVNSIELPFVEGQLILSLPFSWQVFFFCSLSFSVANLIYQYKCPAIIKKYSSYSDFETKEMSLFLLINYLNEHLTEALMRKYFLEIGVIVAKYTPSEKVASEWTSDDTSNVNWRKGVDSLKHSNKDNMPDLFSSLRLVLSDFYKPWLYISFVFYVMGFIGVGVVLLQNIKFVIDQL